MTSFCKYSIILTSFDMILDIYTDICQIFRYLICYIYMFVDYNDLLRNCDNFLGKEISSHWAELFVANMCQNRTSVGERSATMRSWSDIASGSRQAILAAYPRRYKNKSLIIIIFFN